MKRPVPIIHGRPETTSARRFPAVHRVWLKAISILLLAIHVSAQTPPFQAMATAMRNARNGSFSWGDYDNDGDLDILLTGDIGSQGAIAKIYRNDTNRLFATSLDMTGYYSSSSEWGDYDNDGFIDLLLGGLSFPYHTRIYRNVGGTNFVEAHRLPGINNANATWGDYDNDGDLDVALTGGSGGGFAEIYRNDGSSGFTAINAGLNQLYYGSINWADYDLDGDLDLIQAGEGAAGSAGVFIFRNNGFGGFNRVAQLSSASGNGAAWIDVDNDGWMDPYVDAHSSGAVTRIIHNDQGTFRSLHSFLRTRSRIRPALGDFNNDGWTDVFMSGYSVIDGRLTYELNHLFQNAGDGGWIVHTNWFAKAEGFAAWGDYDNDGDLDLAQAGQANLAYVTRLYRNNTERANTPPSAPAGLRVEIDGGIARLFWDESTDAEQSSGLTYNVRIGTLPGTGNIVHPMAAPDGYRRIVARGNAGSTRPFILKGLIRGRSYHWAVQAVDNTFAGSPFSQEMRFIMSGIPMMLIPDSITLAEDAPATEIPFQISDDDTQPDQLIIAAKSSDTELIPESGLSVSGTGTNRHLRIVPAPNRFGETVLSLSAIGRYSEKSTQEVFVIVVPINDPPSFQLRANLAVDEDAGPQSIPDWAHDIRPGPLNESSQAVTFQITAATEGLFEARPRLDAHGRLTFQTASNAHGSVVLTVFAQDDGGREHGGLDLGEPRQFSLLVRPVNDPPTAYAAQWETDEDTSVSFTLNATDPDGDDLQFIIAQSPRHGTITRNGAMLTYGPESNFFGADALTFQVTDGKLTSPAATIGLTVQSVNDAPQARFTVESAYRWPVASEHPVILAPDGIAANVRLNATQSSDIENDMLEYLWESGSPIAPIGVGMSLNHGFPLGWHTVLLTVNDGQDRASLEMAFEIISPSLAMEDLILKVEEAPVDRARRRPLISSLKNVMASLDRNQFQAGSRQLKAFQLKVAAQIAPDHPSSAQEWIILADLVRTALTTPK